MLINYEDSIRRDESVLLKELESITDKKKVLLRDFGCFDIEVTNNVLVESIKWEFPLMYSWAFQLKDNTYVGRTWHSFIKLIDSINDYLNSFKQPKKFNIFVHNLSYEGGFLRNIWPDDEYFITKNLNRMMFFKHDRVSFLCSFLISGMSLKNFTKDVEHAKLSGHDFDYSKIRHQYTDLTDEEMAYIINDVVGQREALLRFMKLKNLTIDDFGTNNDQIKTKSKLARKMLAQSKKAHDKAKEENVENIMDFLYSGDGATSEDFLSDSYEGEIIQPNFDAQYFLSAMTRGGNICPARKYKSAFYDSEHDDKILHDLYSYDANKFYIAILLGEKFPVGQWKYHGQYFTIDEIRNLDNKAFAGTVKFYDLKLKNPDEPIPYIAKGKSINKGTKGGKWYINRRLLKADEIEIVINDIDFKIIDKMYTWDPKRTVIKEAYTCEYGYLPRWYRETLIRQLYEVLKIKKGTPEYEVEKTILHSFGTSSATDPIKPIVILEGDDEVKIMERTEKEYYQNVKHKITRYDWYTWMVSWGRYRLQEVIDLAGDQVAYAGVDSIKTVGPVDLTPYNEQAFTRTICALTKQDIEDYKLNTVGCFVEEYKAKRAKILNTVMYACEFEEPITDQIPEEDYLWAKDALNFTEEDLKNINVLITVSGLNKYRGSMQLYKEGGLDAFKKGYDFDKVPRIISNYIQAPLTTLYYDNKPQEFCGGIMLEEDYGFVLGEGNFEFLNMFDFRQELEEVALNEYRKQRVF